MRVTVDGATLTKRFARQLDGWRVYGPLAIDNDDDRALLSYGMIEEWGQDRDRKTAYRITEKGVRALEAFGVLSADEAHEAIERLRAPPSWSSR